MSEVFGRVILSRKSDLLNRARGYKVLLNGTALDKKISNGSSEEYEVPGGNNKILCKINWCSSNDFSFDIKSGETVYLKVSSGIKYFWPVYILFIVGILWRYFFKEYITKEINWVIGPVYAACLFYIGYYLTFGRKKYLKIEPDTKNIFA